MQASYPSYHSILERLFDGIKKRKHPAIPILGFSDIINTSKIQGQNILHIVPFNTELTPEISASMGQYAKQVLMIFVPWRDQSILDLTTPELIAHFQQIDETRMIKG